MSRQKKRKEKWYQVFRTNPDFIWWEAQDTNGDYFWNEIRLGQPDSDWKSWRMLMRDMTQTIDRVLDNGYTIVRCETGQSRGGIMDRAKRRGIV